MSSSIAVKAPTENLFIIFTDATKSLEKLIGGEMVVYHYSEKLFELDKGFNYKECHKDNLFFLKYKPQGLWISIDDAWEEWCKEEEFALERLKYRYQVNISSQANIIKIESAQQLSEFTDKYILLNDDFFIDWEKVAKDYQGLVIDPYQWKCRCEPKTFWYDGWDCASGCIWDLNAIESIKLEETDENN